MNDVYASRVQETGSTTGLDEYVESVSEDVRWWRLRRSIAKRLASRCVALRVKGCWGFEWFVRESFGKIRSSACLVCGAGRVMRVSKRVGFIVRTVSVEQAIQLGSVSGSWVLMLRAGSKVERYGMSWMPTLKRGRGRRGGVRSVGRRSRREFGSEARRERSYTEVC